MIKAPIFGRQGSNIFQARSYPLRVLSDEAKIVRSICVVGMRNAIVGMRNTSRSKSLRYPCPAEREQK